MENAQDLASALTLRGGIQNVHVSIGTCHNIKKDMKNQQIPKILSLNDFEFLDTGISVRRYSNIGRGKLIKVEERHQTAFYDFWIVTKDGMTKFNRDTIDIGLCSPPKAKPIEIKSCGVAEEEAPKEAPMDPKVGTNSKSPVFHCENEFCRRKFIREKDLIYHQISGVCSIPIKTQSTGDTILSFHHNRYAMKETGPRGKTNRYLATYLQTLDEKSIPEGMGYLEPNLEESNERGFACEKSRSVVRHSNEILDALRVIYDRGTETGHTTSAQVAHSMLLKATLDDGTTRKFARKTIPEVSQIKSLFGRWKAKAEALGNRKIQSGEKQDEPTQSNIEEATADYELMHHHNSTAAAIKQIIAGQNEPQNRTIHPFMVCIIFYLI